MGNSLRNTGWILLGLGVIMAILGGILIAFAVSAEEVETEIARGSDFNMAYDRSYTCIVESFDATSMIKIELNLLGSGPVELTVRVLDPSGSFLLNRKVTTPITLEVDVLEDFSDHWVIKLIFTDDSKNINDVNVRVFGESASESAANLCCAGGILPVVGIILIVIGIIMVVVGKKREKNDNVPYIERGEGRMPYGYPSDPNDRYPSSASYGSTIPGSMPDRSSVQRTYQTSYSPPSENRDPYDTRDGIRIGYRDK